ncbi:hypothetical protein D3C71_796300 [compost metagenome]
MMSFRRRSVEGKQVCYLLLIVFGLNSCGEQTQVSTKKGEVLKIASDAKKVIPTPEKKEDLVIFDMMPIEGNQELGFISISDIHPISEHPDSLAIPDISEKPIDSVRYFKLNKVYRKRFLTATGISETDQVFIFDYSRDMLVSFPVSKLNVVAHLNIYASDEDAPYSQFDYMFGFEVSRKDLKGFDNEYFSDVLIFVGKKNPFERGKLKPIVWRKTEKKQFPVAKMSKEGVNRSKRFTVGNTYTFTKDSLQYYVQELSNGENSLARRLLVLNTKTDKMVFERLYEESEGVSLAPLNHKDKEYDFINQWTGQLFKNRAPVLFGFQYFSFGCPEISFIEKNAEDIYLNCDNRH